MFEMRFFRWSCFVVGVATSSCGGSQERLHATDSKSTSSPSNLPERTSSPGPADPAPAVPQDSAPVNSGAQAHQGGEPVKPTLSLDRAQVLAEREVLRFSSLFSDLSVKRSGDNHEPYRFEVTGREPNHSRISMVGLLLVREDERVLFQGIFDQEVFSIEDAIRREEERRRAVAKVYALPEVRAFCKANAPRCGHLIESSPRAGCHFDENDPALCAWNITIHTVQGQGSDFPHMSKFAEFYFYSVEDTDHLLVSPIQTGDLVQLDQWRCLLKHEWDVDACPAP